VPACICVVCRSRGLLQKPELFGSCRRNSRRDQPDVGWACSARRRRSTMVLPVDQCREPHKTQGASVGPTTFNCINSGRSPNPVDDAALDSVRPRHRRAPRYGIA
jgi:hypothetical protein